MRRIQIFFAVIGAEERQRCIGHFGWLSDLAIETLDQRPKNHFSVRTTAMELGTMNRLYRDQIEKQVHRYLPRIFPSTLKGNTRNGIFLYNHASDFAKA